MGTTDPRIGRAGSCKDQSRTTFLAFPPKTCRFLPLDDGAPAPASIAGGKCKAADCLCRSKSRCAGRLIRPGNCLLCPNAIGVFLLKCFLYFTQHCVIFRAFVTAHSLPISGFRCGFAVGILLKNLIVELFRVRPFLLPKRDPRKSQQQLCGKFNFWQITFYAMALFA